MAKELITSAHVAELAGVSQSAVSRVFTPGASASSAMAKKVRKAADELGYRPNILARSLITGKSKLIGVIVAYLENQFYPEALEKLSKSLQERGYHVLVLMAKLTDDNVDQLLDTLLDYQVEGIVMASVSMSSSLAARCDAAGVPVVLFNRMQDDDRLSAVTSDNINGGEKVAQFLIAGDHKRIAYIAGWDGASTQRDREQGFLQGLNKAGMPLYARDVGNFDFIKAQEAAHRLFDHPEKPDAVFVANDHMALAVMEYLRQKRRLRIPDDVSIVGYDDVHLASWPSFGLTTIRQPSNRMVVETVNMLIAQIKDDNTEPRKIFLESPLIVRKSARIPDDWPDTNNTFDSPVVEQ